MLFRLTSALIAVAVLSCPASAEPRQRVAQADPAKPEPSKIANQPAVPAGQRQALDIAFWTQIKDSGDCEAVRAYLTKFPEGLFVELARLSERRLCAAAEQIAAPASPNLAPLARLAAIEPVSIVHPPIAVPRKAHEKAVRTRPPASRANAGRAERRSLREVRADLGRRTALRPPVARRLAERRAAMGADRRGCRSVPRATGGGFYGDTVQICG